MIRLGKLGTNLIYTERTVKLTGGISRCREILGAVLRANLSLRCGGGGGAGGFGIMAKPGNIAISGADGFPLPRGL